MIAGALVDQVVVVVGGTSGIGLAATRAIRDSGALGVVVTGHDTATTQQAQSVLGAGCLCITGDAREPTHAHAALRLALEAFGRFDALFHVAGGSGRSFGDGPLHEITDPGISATLALNLESVILSNRAAVRSFLDRKVAGAIVNLGSVLAESPAPKYFATHVYAAAKAGLIGFSKSIAAYYAPFGIRCNVLAPALVETLMSRRATENAEIRQYIRTKQPLDGGRIGQPEDLADAAVFLLSPLAKFITGQVLAVDGGWSVSEGQYPTA